MMKLFERIASELTEIKIIKNGSYIGIYTAFKHILGPHRIHTISELCAYKTLEGKRMLSFTVNTQPELVKMYTSRIRGTELGNIILNELNTTPIRTQSIPYYGIRVKAPDFTHLRELFYSFRGQQMPKRKPDPDADLIGALL